MEGPELSGDVSSEGAGPWMGSGRHLWETWEGSWDWAELGSEGKESPPSVCLQGGS